MSRGSIVSSTSLTSSPSAPDSKSNRKYWGEEILQDAIYNVFLKKITYSGNSHASLSSSFSTSCINSLTHAPDSGVSSISSAESDLIDGIQRVFRRRSSFDKNGIREGIISSSPSSRANNNHHVKKNNRSASVSTPVCHQHVFKNGIMASYNPLPEHGFQTSHHHYHQKRDMENIRMKNYHRLHEDSRGSRDARVRPTSPDPPSQSLQWETRQIKTLKAGTLQHIVEYILFQTERQKELKSTKARSNSPNGDSSNHCQSVVLEEERNNVSHVIHVLFIAYRVFATPVQLFQLIQSTFLKHIDEHDQQSQPKDNSNTRSHHDSLHDQEINLVKQLNFVLHYWLSNYPEDFLTPLHPKVGVMDSPSSSSVSGVSNGTSVDSSSLLKQESHSLPTNFENDPSSSSKDRNGRRSSRKEKNRERSRSRKNLKEEKETLHEPKLVDSVLSLPRVDDGIYRKALAIIQDYKPEAFYPEGDSTSSPKNTPKTTSASTSITELDPRFIAQQLTAIDLENFLSVKPYYLLEGTRSNERVQYTIKSFNILSRQVIMSILKSQSPDIVTAHWIEVSLHLRRMKNFNSLKAVIAGLTNESIHRLKTVVWSKLGKTSLANFKSLSSVVDDVNNQTVLRQTQLEVEGTAKVSLQEDFSFGTIPYLGTFFTDLTFIDSRFASSLESKSAQKMINLEKCSKQFEVLTQVQLLQKNVRAAVIAHNQIQNMQGLSPGKNSLMSSNVPVVPRVARLFRTWFSSDNCLLSENECYKISLALEAPTPRKT